MTALPPDVAADLERENARLQAELRSARDRESASAEILRAIASSPGDAGRSLQQIAETSGRLFGAPSVSIQLVENGKWGQAYRFGDSAQRIRSAVPLTNIQVGGRNMPGAVVGQNLQFHIPDLDHLDASVADWPGLPHARAAGTRTMCGTPLRREGNAIGALIIYRDRLLPFTPEELALQQSFADQAVIAIENARLFNETREALERQTATAEILKVIASSPDDVQPVFEAIAESAKRLSGGHSATVTRAIDDMIHLAAFTAGSEAGDKELHSSFPTPLSSPGIHSRVARSAEIAFRTDIETEPGVPQAVKELARARGYRSILVVPMLREGVSIGTIGVTRRDPGMFADHIIDLLKTFADQAVIAIENTRLFNETKEALEQQKASADILSVISNSVADTQPVFEKILRSIEHLFGSEERVIFLLGEDELLHIGAAHGSMAQRARTLFPAPLVGTASEVAIRERRLVSSADIFNDPDIPPEARERSRRLGTNYSMVVAPMLSEDRAIGSILVARTSMVPFSEKECSLLRTFADQAVIAIQNARLFNETKEALERQTATADILKVIASSPDDVQPVFDAIATSSKQLIGAFSATVFRFIDGTVNLVAYTPINPAADEFLKASFPRPAAGLPFFELAKGGKVVQEADSENNPDTALRDIARARGFRSSLFAPLMNKQTPIGLIVVTRKEPGTFADHHIQLVRTFADQAVIAIENVRLFNETQQALERQTATADILKVIASSPDDVQPVFEAIAASALRLFNGYAVGVVVTTGDRLEIKAVAGFDENASRAMLEVFPRPIDRETVTGRVILEGAVVHVPDTEASDVPERTTAVNRAVNVRALMGAPMQREGGAIGAIMVTRQQPGAFSGEQIMLLHTFADQAVIAIENVRLFNETKEALERQTATADILKVIASSPDDVQPVFEAIAGRSKRLIGGFSTSVFSIVDDMMHLSAFTPTNPEADAALKTRFPSPLSARSWGEPIRNGEIVLIPDTEAEGAVSSDLRESARMRGYRSMLHVPLLREHSPIGLISVTRVEPGPFPAHHVQLLETFADQAVIAIENVRLFNETREALERQTATADILKVIASSPDDVQPVFEAIATSSNKLIGGFSTAVLRFIGDQLHLAAFTPTNPEADETLQASFPRPVAEFPPFMLVRNGETVEFADTESDDVPQLNRELARLRGYRSMLFTPLMNGDTPIGLISVTRREPGKFAPHHVELVRTFADQAVIAIENVRLFDEVQAKTRDLTEALTYQTGSSNILSVIASSPTDVAPVLKAIVESACELCDAYDAVVLLKDGDDLRFSAHHGPLGINLEKWPISRNWTAGRAFVDRKPVHVRDLLSDEGAQFPDSKELSRHTGSPGMRSILGVPLLRENESIGAILLRRTEVQPFSDKQIAMLQTFADQAVIAIGNVRLFDEVQARTRDLTESLQQQTATADVLKVISRSAFDLDTVMNTLASSASELCGADRGALFLREDDLLVLRGRSEMDGELTVSLRNAPVQIDSETHMGRAVLSGTVANIGDFDNDPNTRLRTFQRALGFKSFLAVPLMREGRGVGVFTLTRSHVGAFSQRQIDLVQTFADQAVIAIENVRLFDEVQARTKELAASLDDLRTAQDRLVQTEKLASLGQLTAGIAHEIKNPLNFVNNFSALSAELTDELNDLLKSAVLTDKLREEVDELTGMLKDNLQKVVQHGKRADSIVKNMLLHSREGSGDHRPADINALLDESLNLAYHGARAEKREFNVTLQRDFDETAGSIEVFPQEITRVFLNLISNGFYAVTKRKMENGNSGFEPVVIATTRSLGDTVEIRIRDNGTGIPDEVREKMFNPFFTTKPAGEGTGLGLSMSHDIIVKQHGGKIDVATEPGQFTEFTIVLPRTSNQSNKVRGQT
jgi:GAF domain-containing protein